MNKEYSFKQISHLWKTDKEKMVKRTTIAAYSIIIDKYLTPYFEDRKKINEKDIQLFVDEKLKQGLNAKTVKDILTVLRMIIKYGHAGGYIDIPGFKVSFPKEYKTKDLAVFTVCQHKKLLRYLTLNLDNRNLGILLCLNTGMRIGEICALKWGDIDMAMGYLRIDKTLSRIYNVNEGGVKTELLVTPPKTKHSCRSIPLTTDLIKLIKAGFPARDSGSYVVTGKSVPTEPRSYRNYYRRLLKELRLPYIKFHGMRHSFATRCIESQCDYKSVSDILGHSDISTTLNLYVHPTFEQKKQCIEKMMRTLRSK